MTSLSKVLAKHSENAGQHSEEGWRGGQDQERASGEGKNVLVHEIFLQSRTQIPSVEEEDGDEEENSGEQTEGEKRRVRRQIREMTERMNEIRKRLERD